MVLPAFNMRQLLEAGVHFGHKTHRWNPKMSQYIFGSRNNIHIIDLAQTVPLLHQALVTVSDTVARGGRVLFVGTKRAASDTIAEAARQSAQYYINHRWLGGTLTNWKTISHSIKRLNRLEELLDSEGQGLTKKELLRLTRERDKIQRALGGIKDIGGLPDMLFVIDTNKESIAVAEARKLNIPVIAVVDTNCDPDEITHPIPGNDDAGRAITLYCDLIARAAIDGIERAQGSAGIDAGESATPAPEGTIMDAGEPAAAQEEEPAATEEPAAATDGQAGAGDEAARARAAGPEPSAAGETATEKAAGAKSSDKKAAGKKTGDGKAAAGETETESAKDTKKSGGFEPLKKPDGTPDNLKEITGVGPVLEKNLNEYGIYHYRQIAGLKKAEIQEIDAALNLKGRVERDDWVKQAKELAKKSA